MINFSDGTEQLGGPVARAAFDKQYDGRPTPRAIDLAIDLNLRLLEANGYHVENGDDERGLLYRVSYGPFEAVTFTKAEFANSTVQTIRRRVAEID